ncbi:YciI family protein [Kineobactrum salinum]|uniref:YciI family protein n=1 Tax=Kineobactrum salinum TaxID=2708301 RepID=A0A6C0TX48_9GAMM|nr:YciI family protein [Kineobactrum salinum]QIB64208.1 YciI family protein [Kineobactrum salinum]
MKYLCLAYEEERKLTELTDAQWRELRQETLDYVADLQQRGKLVLTNALQSARSAHTVKIREDQRAVTDGPFAETKEQIGGFFLIEAESEDEALDIAAGWPSARIGTIEVRPIEEALRLKGRY